MAERSLIEAEFLIRIRGDKALSDGTVHSAELWERLRFELYERFGAYTWAPGYYSGAYRDCDTNQPVHDESRKCTIALPDEQLEELRDVLSLAAVLFRQKCIYLSVAGRVHFVERLDDTDPERISRFGRP